MPQSLQKLTEYFRTYPGVGPKQAERFALFVLQQPPQERNKATTLLSNLNTIHPCKRCFFPIETNEKQCEVCRNSKRNKMIICVVEKEPNVIHIEKTHLHQGVYFVLGGMISPLTNDTNVKKRIHFLARLLNLYPHSESKEIILALNNTREGNFTALYLIEIFKKHPIPNTHITRLAKGLASGSEIDYIDAETLSNALRNRTT